MNNQFLKLYSSCMPVRGMTRSTICDLQRNEIYFIPNSLFSMLLPGSQAIDIASCKDNLEESQSQVFDDYINFLIDNELGWLCSGEEMEHFPVLDLNWEFPSFITNCILDCDEIPSYLDSRFLDQLESLCCNYIQIRFYQKQTFDGLQYMLNLLNPSQVKAIEIIVPFIKDIERREIVFDFMNFNRKVRNLTFSDSPNNCILKHEDEIIGSIYLTKEKITDHSHCGIIEYGHFSVNIPHYIESLNYNTCLNRKISIDKLGNIKNCPSMSSDFGNIRDTLLVEALEKPGFKKYWNINKDKVNVCKSCEFRYICTDCRAFLEDPLDELSKPLKCGYDPENSIWSEWSTHPLKQKGISFYGLDNGDFQSLKY